MTNRRKFLTLTLLAPIGALLANYLPKSLVFVKNVGATPVTIAHRVPTVASIFQVSFRSVLDKMRNGKPFVDDFTGNTLNKRVLAVEPLGPAYTYNDKSYEIRELAIPVVWAQTDEDKCNTEEKRIELVKQLMVNAICSHDDALTVKYPNHHFVLSKDYTYDLSDIMEIAPRTDDDGKHYPRAFIIRVYSALVAIPDEDIIPNVQTIPA